MSGDFIIGRPSDEEMRAYLDDDEHGPPHPEVVGIIQDNLERAIRAEDAAPSQPEQEDQP